MPKLKPPFKLNVPMLLTWMRIAMIPLVIGIFYLRNVDDDGDEERDRHADVRHRRHHRRA